MQGAGFDRYVQYKCVFTGIGLLAEQLTTLAFLNSATLLSCSSPRSEMTILWDMEMQAAVTITANNVEVPFAGSNPTQTYIKYTVMSWSAATPVQAYTAGGAVITVAGTGFSSTGFSFSAKFVAGPYQAFTTCSPASTVTLMCPIPGIVALYLLYTIPLIMQCAACEKMFSGDMMLTRWMVSSMGIRRNGGYVCSCEQRYACWQDRIAVFVSICCAMAAFEWSLVCFSHRWRIHYCDRTRIRTRSHGTAVCA